MVLSTASFAEVQQTGKSGPDGHLRSVNAPRAHTAASQGKRDPASPDRKFEHPSVARQRGEKVHDRLRVTSAVMLVIDTDSSADQQINPACTRRS